MEIKRSLMIGVAWLGLLVPAALAQDIAALQARMKERVEAIAVLKLKQVIGETQQGYLAQVDQDTPNADARKLITAENADRRQLYKLVAARTGVSVDQVAAQRARSIYEKAIPGVMLQGRDGMWYEKR